jgi:hypothetical protein
MHLIHLRLTLSAKNESPWRVHLFNLRNIMVSYRMLALNHYALFIVTLPVFLGYAYVYTSHDHSSSFLPGRATARKTTKDIAGHRTPITAHNQIYQHVCNLQIINRQRRTETVNTGNNH